MNISKLAQRQADELVGNLLDDAAYRAERVIAMFRAALGCLFLVIHLIEDLAPGPLDGLVTVIALSVVAYSGLVVQLCRRRLVKSTSLAKASLVFDGLVFLVPALAYEGPPEWNLLSQPGVPLLALMIVTAGLRFSKPIATFGVGVGVAVFCSLVCLEYAGASPPSRFDILVGLLLVTAASTWALLGSSETRRLVMQGAISSMTANIDGLTGIRNRRFLRDYLDEALSRARAADKPMCVVMSDIDHFKAVNDTYGHDAGDEVLKLVARTIEQTLRGADLVARYGGEEFALVLDTGLEQGELIAERVREAVERLEVSSSSGPINPTLSLGVALLESDDADIQALLKRADEALYRAKENGRNRVCVAAK